MAQTGYTPISIYYSATATNTPTAGNLVAGELAINTNDGVLYYKDSSGVVQSIASKAGNSGSFTNLAYTGTLTGGTGVVNLGSGQFYKDASGNVGIGTSSLAGQRLYVFGGTSIFNQNSASGSTITVDRTSNPGSVQFNFSGTQTAQFSAISGGGIATYTGSTPTESMRINSSGKLLIGRTTAGTALASGSAPDSWALTGFGVYDNTNTVTYNSDRISFNASNYYVINAASTGVYLANGGVAWVALSDERHKDIIEPITDATNKVSTLRAVIGKYKTDKKGTRRSFLIAQDVQAILPEAVDARKEDALGLQYTDVIPLLVAAIKEQQALIENLTTRLTALESK